MNTIFTYNPIILNILSNKCKLLQKIIIINTTDTNIIKILKDLENKYNKDPKNFKINNETLKKKIWF